MPGVEGSKSTEAGLIVPLPCGSVSLPKTLIVTGVFGAVLVLSATATGGALLTMTLMLAEPEVAPWLSATVYWIVEVPANVGSGVKVTAPVAVFTVYVPSPAMVRLD